MAFESTATRKRPRDFDSLAGQEFVATALRNSTKTGKVAHAYLFAGPRGVGKTSAARILARTINCEKAPTATPCGTCAHCKEILSGNSLDVIEIDGASNTSVNDIRQIKDEVLFAPSSCRYKIYIIDEVHMLSNSAFNALLKTIEEPPEYIVFIFATTEIHKVPATIRSRCQQFNFHLIPTETIVELLKKNCDESGIKADEEALFWMAKEATGSMRDAYTLFDQVVAFCGTGITIEQIREKLGLIGLDQINQLATFFINGNREEALVLLDQILTSGISAEQFIIDLTEYFRSLLFIKSGINRESLLGYKKERFSSQVVEALTLTQLEEGISLLLKLYRDIRFSLSQRFELELLISKFCTLNKFFTSKELLGMISGLKRELVSQFGNAEKKDSPVHSSSRQESDGDFAFHQSTSQPEKLATVSPATDLNSPTPPLNNAGTDSIKELPDDQKIQLIENALQRQQLPALCASLRQVEKWEFETNRITLHFSNPYHLDMVKQNLKRLEESATKLFQVPMLFRLETITPPSTEESSTRPADVRSSMIQDIFKATPVNFNNEN